MSTGDQLLARVCEAPDDVDARRVYADWLLDRGDARGTFIAQHCELEAMGGLEPNYPELLASTRRLEAQHPPRWMDEFFAREGATPREAPRIALDEQQNAVFRHGFLHRIALPPEALAREWEWLRAREPIQGVELLVGESLPAAYHALRQPQAFRTLKVSPSGWFFVNSVGAVLRWGLSKLRELDLSKCDLGPTGCRLLANLDTDLATSFDDWTPPPPLRDGQLERLVLHGTQIGDEGARLLFTATPLRDLVELDVSQCRIAEGSTLAALRASPLHQLRRLSLAGNVALGGHFDALAGWPVLERLEALSLPQTCTPDDLGALFPAPSKHLRALDLSSAKALVKHRGPLFATAEALTHLDLGTTSLGDDGFVEVLASEPVHSVVELRANGCSLSDQAVAALVDSDLHRLVTLDLSSNKLTDAALQALAQWEGLAQITHLRLANNRKLGLPGYRALVASPHLQPVALDVGKPSDPAIAPLLRERFGRAVRARD
ncbi:MAG: TIGR02996 domain-containing protein [Myxococcales bacterium]|nr:TIGR02996 domain-containing protein [Myxococcales bacterium]